MILDRRNLLNKDEYLARLEQLTEALNGGDTERVDTLLTELALLRESELFHELGKLTREIHNSITGFSMDQRIVELAQAEIPDAQERLHYVVEQTENAAHRTMSDVDNALEVVEQLKQNAEAINQSWATFRNGTLSRTEFLELSDDLDGFLAGISQQSDQIRTQLTDIMMAQDYQDLTGQMIKQVVTLVQEIEEKLVRLVAISGAKLAEKSEQSETSEKAVGPQLASADGSKVVKTQNDVDDLLANLGF